MVALIRTFPDNSRGDSEETVATADERGSRRWRPARRFLPDERT